MKVNVNNNYRCLGEGNGNPLQCSCLENPRDGGAWWASVYEVTQSRTRLKWLSSSSSKMIKPVNPKGNQSWIFTEGQILKLKLQYFGHLMKRADSLKKTPTLGKIKGRRRRGRQRTRWLDGITNSMDMNWASSGRWWRVGKPGVLQSMGSQRGRHDWAIEQQKVWWCLLIMCLLHFKILVYFYYCKKLS